MRRVGVVLATAMVGAGALAGCSGGDGGGSDDGPPSPAAKPLTFSVEAALRELPPVEPADDEPLQVFAGNLAKLAEEGDLPKPVDKQSTSVWFRGLNGPEVYLNGAEGLGLTRLQTGAMRKVLGFDTRDVETYAAVESLPDAVTVLQPKDGVTPKKGVTATGAGKIGDIDPAATADAPFPQIFGVARQGDQVVLAKTQKMLNTWKARGDGSLADYEPFLEVARALDSHPIYDAVLSDRPSNVPPLGQAVYDEMRESMPEFGAVGVAEGVEDGEPVEYIAYHVEDVTQAEEKIEAVWENGISLRRNEWFQELFDVEDVSTEGNVVMVKIVSRAEAGIAANMLLMSDTAFFVLD